MGIWGVFFGSNNLELNDFEVRIVFVVFIK